MDNAICAGMDQRENIPIRRSQQVKVLPRAGKQNNGKVDVAYDRGGFRQGLQLWRRRCSGEVTEYPAILTHKLGKGRVVYFASDVSSDYGNFGDPSLRKLLSNAVRWANDVPLPVETDAPLAVEVRCYRQENRYLVHLMNYVTSQTRAWTDVGGTAAEDTIPIRDITIRLGMQKSPSRAYLASSKRSIPLEYKNNFASMRVPELDVFEILVVE